MKDSEQHKSYISKIGSNGTSGVVTFRTEDVVEVIRNLDGLKRKLKEMLNT